MSESATHVPPLKIYRAKSSVHPLEALRALYAQRELLLAWTSREIRVRHKQAALGAAWAVLQPLAPMLIFTVIFTNFVHVPTNDVPYPLFSYVALLPWTLFSTAVTNGTNSIVNNMGLVSKIQFPREILPLAQIGAALFDFGIGSLLFIGLMLLYHWPFGWSFLGVFVLLLIQLALMSGLALILAATTVRFRDIRFVVPLALQLWLYATPIIYPLDVVPARWEWLIRLNPMTALIVGYRQAVLFQQWPLLTDFAYPAACALLACVVGYLYFKRTEADFADIL